MTFFENQAPGLQCAEGDQCLSPNTGAPGWVLGTGRGRPLPL